MNMKSSLATKLVFRQLVSPTLPSTILHRSSLLADLLKAVTDLPGSAKEEASPYKLILLNAPAGYGKTTLLADFARHTSIPCCWYFLEESDKDVVNFLELLIASIRQQFPQFGTSLSTQLCDTIAQGDHTVMYQRLEALIDELSRAMTDIPQRFALILCDYHKVNQSTHINELVNRFIQRLPPQCVLILETRAVPRLEFVQLLAHRQILGIGSDALRFSVQEIQELARLQHIELTNEEALVLERSFGGWITGIMLCTQLGDLRLSSLAASSATIWGAPALKAEREHLFAYLIQEVFAREADAYGFLKEAVILRQMTPGFCTALLGIPDAAERLAYLEQQGLFVTHYRLGEEKYYLCHPVLRDLLYDELRTHAPARLKELHLRAIDLFRRADDQEAIYHALAAQAFEAAASLIENSHKSLFTQGRLTTLAHWIDALPLEVANDHPRLLLVRATIFLEESELTQVQELLDRAFATVTKNPQALELQAEILFARAMLLNQQGDYLQAQKLGREALTLLPVDEVELCATAHQLLGSCAAYLNDFREAIAEWQQALQLYGHENTTRPVAKLHTMLANLYGMTGHNELSEHHRTRAIQCWEGLHDEWGKIDNIIGLGAIKHRQGAFQEAERAFTQALEASRKAIYYRCGEAYALTNLGELYQEEGKYQQSLLAHEDALSLARQINDTYLEHYLVCQIAMTYLLMGDSQNALRLVEQIGRNIPQVEAIHDNERAFYALVRGTILFHLQLYDEAYRYFTVAETAFSESKYEQIQASLRRAACLLALGKEQEALSCAQRAEEQARQCSYEHLIHLELRCLPALRQLFSPLSGGLNHSQAKETRQGALQKESFSGSPFKPAEGQKTSTLRILALGEPEVLLDGTPIRHWRMAKSMELFFLLLNATRPLHKEQIIVALWPEADEQIGQTLRSTLHYLRKTLGASSLLSQDGVYRLNLAAVYGENIWYDVAAFQEQEALARTALAGEDDPAAERAFEEMIRLYRGDYLRSFYSDWCLFRRDELRRAYLDAHHHLALIAFRQQKFEKSISHWQQILALDNCLEAAHEGIIRCYLKQNRRGLALRQYQHCADSLNRELGIAPGAAVQELYKELAH